MLWAWEKAVLVLVILATVFAFVRPVYVRYRIVRQGRPESRGDGLGGRLADTLSKVFLQRCTLKNERRFTGLMHVLIFYSALTFDTMTVNHTLEGFFDGFYLFGGTRFGLWFSFLVDAMAVAVLIGVAFFIVRRFIIRPTAYRTTPWDSAAIYFFLVAVTLSYMDFEVFALARHPEAGRLSFLGKYLAGFLGLPGLPPASVEAHYRVSWWIHILFVYGFIAYVPYSKYFHMFTGPVNVFFGGRRSSRSLPPVEIEQSEVFGIEKTADFTWKDNLDAFACMECGRCQDACPASTSGKPLSPKMILVNQEKRLLKERGNLLNRRREGLSLLFPDTYAEGEIWTCTTCGACQHVCPVEIEHIRKIVGVRRSEVLMQGRFPQELNAFFRNLETNGNPWGLGFAKRADWATGLDIPVLAEKKSADVLLWVGCAGSYDEQGIQVTRAVVTLLRKAGVDFGILGTEEKCCGDSARRLGQEYLFQTLAEENLRLFLNYQVKTIITFCPHGFNTFQNEYPQLWPLLSSFSEEDRQRLSRLEIVPHVRWVHDLLRQGKLALKPGAGAGGRTVYHDPCYLGRHNGILREPREILSRLNGIAPAELENNREHSFCCGAGGGMMWTEEKLGRRINHLRTEEVIRSGAPTAATSCPFCLNMIRDGLKDKERPDILVRDIAQLVAESLDS